MAVFTMNFPQLLASSGMSTDQQVQAMKSYLYQLTEQLQYALNHIDEENIGESVRSQIQAANTAAIQIKDLSEAQRLELDEYVKRLNDTDQELAEMQTKRMYRIEMLVDGPSIMTKRDQTAVMQCRVYSWDQDITDQVPAESFQWRRSSADSVADLEWDEYKGKGRKQITITTEDISENASFCCVVTI